MVGRLRPSDPHVIYSDIKFKKKKRLQIKIKVRGVAAAMRSGQVAVGVFLSVHSLQVLLLYQDVDAFLATRGRQSAPSANQD